MDDLLRASTAVAAQDSPTSTASEYQQQGFFSTEFLHPDAFWSLPSSGSDFHDLLLPFLPGPEDFELPIPPPIKTPSSPPEPGPATLESASDPQPVTPEPTPSEPARPVSKEQQKYENDVGQRLANAIKVRSTWFRAMTKQEFHDYNLARQRAYTAVLRAEKAYGQYLRDHNLTPSPSYLQAQTAYRNHLAESKVKRAGRKRKRAGADYFDASPSTEDTAGTGDDEDARASKRLVEAQIKLEDDVANWRQQSLDVRHSWSRNMTPEQAREYHLKRKRVAAAVDRKEKMYERFLVENKLVASPEYRKAEASHNEEAAKLQLERLGKPKKTT